VLNLRSGRGSAKQFNTTYIHCSVIQWKTRTKTKRNYGARGGGGMPPFPIWIHHCKSVDNDYVVHPPCSV